MNKNKRSCKDLSCVFKITIIICLFFLLSGSLNIEGESNNYFFDFPDSDNDLFLMPNVLHEESSEITIFQENTIYASSPLYFPNQVQVFGVQAEENKDDKCKKEIISRKVKSGESLGRIASKFEISVNTIVWANDLENNTIKPGQELVILPVSGVFHMVKPGETISGIAQKYKADKNEIIFCNDIEEAMTGDILIIPGGKISTTTPKPPSSLSLPSSPSPSSLSSSWLISPTSGYISQRLHHYNAVDIANNCGTPIYASASGTIQKTGYHGTAGHYVRILHSNGIVTFYGHLSKILVSSGQKINQGNVIGHMGNTGYTIGPTGCHVHFEVRGGTNPFGKYPLNHRF